MNNSGKIDSIWLKLGLGAGLCHLVLVSLGALEFEFDDDNWWEKTINYYGEISGSSSGYGFFAPSVNSQIRAVFEVMDLNSRVTTLELEDGRNREVDLRVGDIIEQFTGNERENPLKFQRELSATLSAYVFAKYQGARTVKILLEQFTPVSMSEFREGKRTTWVSLYSAEFISHQGGLK